MLLVPKADMRRRFHIWMVFCSLCPLTGQGQTAGLSDTMFVQWEQAISPFPSSGLDVPADVVTDSEGNIIVAGKSEGAGTDFDYLTVKYNQAGVELWRASYDGPAHAADIPVAMALDEHDDIYITGMSVGGDSSYFDIVTVKYDRDGSTAWVSRYDGPASGSDAPAGIAVRGSTVVVAGQVTVTDGTHLHRDIITISYAPGGAVDWARLHGGFPNRDDRARAVVINASGMITVCGSSDRDSGFPWAISTSLAVLQYDAVGNERWGSGFGPVGDLSVTVPAGMAAGTGGSTVIAASHSTQWLNGGRWSRTDEILTMMFGPDGALLWVDHYGDPPADSNPAADFAADVAVTAGGDVYVTGTTGSYNHEWGVGDQVLTISYSPEGWRRWSRLRPGPAGTLTRAVGIATDPFGGALVVANHGVMQNSHRFVSQRASLLRYTASGELSWEQTIAAGPDSTVEIAGLAVDSWGSTTVAGSNGILPQTDFLVSTYSGSGFRRWTALVSGSGPTVAFVTDALVDEDGNTYGTGGAITQGTEYDVLTWKIDSEGNLVWWQTFDAGESRSDHPEAILLTPDGRVVVAGLTEPELGAFLVSYDAATGVQQWVRVLDTNGFIRICADPESNVITNLYESLLKVDPDGETKWVIPVSGYGRSWTDQARNIYCDDEAGYTKYNPDGNAVWTVTDNFYSYPAVDDSGSSYVYLESWPGYPLVRYAPSGNRVWEIEVPGYGEVVVNDGDVYVGVTDFLARVDTSGQILWSHNVGGSGYYWKQLSFEPEGGMFVSGTYLNNESFYHWEIRTDRFRADGTIAPTLLLSEREGGEPMIRASGTDADGNLYIIGERWFPNGLSKPFVAKYGPIGVTSAEQSENLPATFRLLQNYPNPFNPQSVIEFELPAAGFVTLEVFNVLGERVSTLVKEHLEAGRYKRTFEGKSLSSGVYFYRLSTGTDVAARRMMLVK